MVDCRKCNIPLEEKRINATLVVNDTIVVPLKDVKVYCCPKCGSEIAPITHIFSKGKLRLSWGGNG